MWSVPNFVAEWMSFVSSTAAASLNSYLRGATENAGKLNGRQNNSQGWKFKKEQWRTKVQVMTTQEMAM